VVCNEAKVLGIDPIHVHSVAFPGFSAVLSNDQKRMLEMDPTVAAVVPDFRVSCYGGRLSAATALRIAEATPSLAKAYNVSLPKEQKGEPVVAAHSSTAKSKVPLQAQLVISPPASPLTPWGVRRINGCSTNRNRCVASASATQELKSVRVYVVDTGVDSNHPSLRVVERKSFVRGETDMTDDLNGHGTHVAGTIAGYRQLFGVAAGSHLVSLRVLDANGGGSFGDVIAALDSIARDRLLFPRQAMVVNMSLGVDTGSTRYTPLDVAIQRLISQRVHVVLAAGNDGISASTVTPAHVREAITVGAYDSNNRIAPFSNYGSAVTILAPGVNIPSTWMGGRFASLSGTSMAAPHVTGAVALYLTVQPTSRPDMTKQVLLRVSQNDRTNSRVSVSGRPQTTLLSASCLNL
jgi:subtilisin family serine protease